MIEPLKELPAPPANLPECDIRFITVYLWDASYSCERHWTTCHHKTLQQAEAEGEWAVPGTLRIFEVPEVKHGE